MQGLRPFLLQPHSPSVMKLPILDEQFIEKGVKLMLVSDMSVESKPRRRRGGDSR